MGHYAVIDTNVLVSALITKKSDSPTVSVARELFSGRIIPLYTDEIMEEYEEVLKRKKFHFQNSTVDTLLRFIRQSGVFVNPSPTGEVLPDLDDLVFYEVMMEKREADSYLVTGDLKHYPVREYIVTPAEMLRILQKNKE